LIVLAPLVRADGALDAHVMRMIKGSFLALIMRLPHAAPPPL
jgi:hypothetical protein